MRSLCESVGKQFYGFHVFGLPQQAKLGKGIEMIEWVCVARHVGLMLTLWCGFAFCGFAFCEGYLRHVPPSQCLSLDSADCPKHLLGNLRYASRGKLEEPLLYYSLQSTYFLHLY